jgi:hypothetical protein
MKLSAIGSMVLVVLAVAWLGSLAFAQLSEERRGPPPGGGDGRPGRGPEQGPPGGEFRPPLHPLMIALDADKDGELSAEEIANASAALKKLDKNADGILNREELRPQGGPQRPGFGGPGNAGPEFGSPGGGPGGQGPMPGGGGPREGGPGRRGFGGPPAGGPGGPGGPDAGPRGPGGPGGGYHLIPRFAVEQMNLTAKQLEQIAELEKETKAKLDKILTPEQQKILEESRPPRPEGQGGPGMPGGPGGPGGGRFGPGGGPRDGPGADQGQGPDRPQPPQRPAS